MLTSATKPIALETTPSGVFVLASRAITEMPRVYRVAKTGGLTEECSTRKEAPLTQASIAAASDQVFVAQDDGILRCTDGCGAAPCAKIVPNKTTSVIGVASDALFWTDVDKNGLGDLIAVGYA